MKTKIKRIFLALCLVGLSSTLFAQNFAVDKKAVIISGTASFRSSNGGYFSPNNQTTTYLDFSPTVNYFFVPNLFVGGSLGYSYQKSNGIAAQGLNIGPQIGYAFGDENSKIYPYVKAGIWYSYSHIKSSQFNMHGTNTFLGAGVIVPVKHHIGLVLGAKYNMLHIRNTMDPGVLKGNTFSISIGITGLLFKK